MCEVDETTTKPVGRDWGLMVTYVVVFCSAATNPNMNVTLQNLPAPDYTYGDDDDDDDDDDDIGESAITSSPDHSPISSRNQSRVSFARKDTLY